MELHSLAYSANFARTRSHFTPHIAHLLLLRTVSGVQQLMRASFLLSLSYANTNKLKYFLFKKALIFYAHRCFCVCFAVKSEFMRTYAPTFSATPFLSSGWPWWWLLIPLLLLLLLILLCCLLLWLLQGYRQAAAPIILFTKKLLSRARVCVCATISSACAAMSDVYKRH